MFLTIQGSHFLLLGQKLHTGSWKSTSFWLIAKLLDHTQVLWADILIFVEIASWLQSKSFNLLFTKKQQIKKLSKL